MAAASRPVSGPVREGPRRAAAPPAPPPATERGSPGEVVLKVRDLRTQFFTYDGVVKALDGVSFDLRRGETTGLVGETGCGKSVTAFSITRLIPDPPGRIVGGQVVFGGVNLLAGIEKEARLVPIPKTPRVRVHRSFHRIKAAALRMGAIRGHGISMIFQEPTQAMNPIMSISAQLIEVLQLHQGPEVIDALLAATPEAPGLPDAISAMGAAAAENRREAIRSAAEAVGAAAHLSSFATQAFYAARETYATPDDVVRRLESARARLRLTPIRRRYLASRRRLMVLRQRLLEIYLEEMREPGRRVRGRFTLSVRRAWERLSHFYFGVWGVRRRLAKPLEEELFWRAVRQLEGVSIANPVQVARGYPHELSGGMLQRVMIAMALASEPDILLADEPTTALDVTIQAQILALMRDLKERVGTAILLITHDLAVIAEVADRVCVMYAGLIIESAPVKELFRRPLHPYTQGLLASIPRLDQPDKQLSSIPGSVPNLITPPSGCRFHPRCPHAMPVCKTTKPPVTVEGGEHTVACFLYSGPPAAD